tara:strand:+ start:1566 stop:1889 length:324 start_codon:yes stop_codon:yes gene_type:complete
MKQHFLFICSSGGRAKKASELFEDDDNIEARCVSLFPLVGSNITNESVKWANKIFVMNEKEELHKTQLLSKIPDSEEKEIIDLDMPQISQTDPKFEDILREKIKDYL